MNNTKTYEQQEIEMECKFLSVRSKLGNWKQEECPDAEGSVNRISWLLNGTYGAGAMFYAKGIITNALSGKTGKNIDKAWLAIGRELTMLVALHDSTEYTFQKITECWKKQGIDFAAINAQAAKEVKEFLQNEVE